MSVVEFSIERRAQLFGVCEACLPLRGAEVRPQDAGWFRWCHRCHAFFSVRPDRPPSA
jgi:hypothetical protein